VLKLAAALGVLACLCAVGSAAAAPRLPGSVWGVAVTSSPARDVAWKVSSTLPKKGFNTVVVDRRVLSAPGYVAFRRQARQLRLTLVAGRQAGTACASCLPLVGSATAGVKLSRTGGTVLVRLSGPTRIHQLRGLRRGRTIAIVELRGGAAFSATAWRQAIAVARKEPRLDLVVAPTGARAAAAFTAFTRILGERTVLSSPEPGAPEAPGSPPPGGGAASSDTLAPTSPGSLSRTASTTTSISVMWSASIDNVGVSFYGLFRNGASAATATGTSYTYTGLACGTTYSLGVEAVDAAGNRSSPATISAATSSCSPQTPPPVPSPPPPPPTPPPAPASGTANLWVDLNGGSCTRQGTAAAYVDALTCGSWNAAYQAASPGDTVLVRGGTYASQRVLDRTNIALGTASVVFHPAPGESILMNSLQLYAHDFILDGGDVVGANEPNRITIRGEQAPDEEALGMRDNQGSQDGQHRNLIVEDVHIRNVKTSSDYSVLRYSDVGPSDMGTGNLCSDLVQSADEPTFGWVVEYNLVHDNTSAGCGGAHIDAFDVYVVDGVIRGNRVWWCGTQCIFTGDPSSILIENNMIEETNACGGGCDGPQELAVMGATTVRYNTIEGYDGYGRDPDRPGNANVYANVFLTKYVGCAGGGTVSVTYDRNVFAPGSDNCGTNARFCTPRLADGNLYTNVDRQADYHLAANDTCALGAGNQSLYPARDLDEASRPSGPVDAGADER